MKSKRIILSTTLLALFGIDSSQQIRLHLANDAFESLDQATVNAMAFSSNAIASLEGKSQIKTLAVAPKKVEAKTEPEPEVYNEDEAIAALQQKQIWENADLGQEEDAQQEPVVKQADSKSTTAKAAPKPQQQPKKEALISNVDLSNITPDGKNPASTVLVKKDRIAAKPAPARPRSTLPEANVDLSGIVAEEIQNDVDDIGDEVPAQSLNSDAQLEAEGQAAIAAQPAMHDGKTTLKSTSTKAAHKLTKKELEAKEERRKDDAGENDLQDDLAANNADLEEEGKAVMAMSAATVEAIGDTKDAAAHASAKQPGPEASTNVQTKATSGGEVTILEQLSEKDKLQQQYLKVKKEQEQQEKETKKEQAAAQLTETTWGQLDVMQAYAKDTVTKAQGFEDPEPEEPKVQAPAPPKLSAAQQEKQDQEKLRLFSEFVAADAEANQPAIKKAEPTEAPLHFKYYHNEGEESELTEVLTDNILSGESHQVTKGKVNLKYDHSDPEWGVKPVAPVDYSKAQKDMQTLLEPIETMEVQEAEGSAQKEAPAAAGDQEIIELTTS